MNKEVKYALKKERKQWVGDGFYTYPLLHPNEGLNEIISPFILIDYASPHFFEASKQVRGVGTHPHRGFETVTLVYQGEIEHRDSSGGGGVIKPGDAQWMTAGSGIVHNEFHSKAFSEQGGILEMVQLWVNLPKKDKMTPPKYQNLQSKDIPKLEIGSYSQLRVIAGEFSIVKGPASTFSNVNIFDLKSESKDNFTLPLREKTNTLLLILDGSVQINGREYEKNTTLVFEQGGQKIGLESSDSFKGLLLNGTPINEPIVTQGPFVMNTREEISQAIRDFQNGKMGKITGK